MTHCCMIFSAIPLVGRVGKQKIKTNNKSIAMNHHISLMTLGLIIMSLIQNSHTNFTEINNVDVTDVLIDQFSSATN